jgi:transketolase
VVSPEISSSFQRNAKLRKQLLTLYKTANAGHIGASLSCLDLLAHLAFVEAKVSDDILLSKGHAAAALYLVFEETGRLPKGSIEKFYKDGTHFAAHPPCNRIYPSIPFGTGSLGHGLGLATGIALGAKLKKTDKKVYVILSDGELNEGSTWESLMFARQHQLGNLTIVVDKNGLQGLGSTKSILDLGNLEEKFRAFGFQVKTIEDGNNPEKIEAAFAASGENANARGSEKEKTLDNSYAGPRVIVAHTKKGAGVSYMENKFEWHYLPMNEEQFSQAISESERKDA